MSNYFKTEKNLPSHKYDCQKTYLKAIERDENSLPYVALSDDYDVFSFFDKSYLYRTDTKQFELISLCFQFLRGKLVRIMREDRLYRRERVLPKIIMVQGEDGSIAFNWAFSSFRATLLFESEEGDKSAYCSIVFQRTADSISIETDEVNENNYSKVMEKLLFSVIENS